MWLPTRAPSLPPRVPSTGASRAAVPGALLRPDADADTLDLGTSDDALMTHAGGTGAVGGHPAAAFGVLLPTGEAACVPGRQV